MDMTALAAAVAIIRRELPQAIEEAVLEIDAVKELEQEQQGNQVAIVSLATETAMLIRDLAEKYEVLNGLVTGFDDRIDVTEKAAGVSIQQALLLLATGMDAQIRSLQASVETLQNQVKALSS